MSRQWKNLETLPPRFFITHVESSWGNRIVMKMSTRSTRETIDSTTFLHSPWCAYHYISYTACIKDLSYSEGNSSACFWCVRLYTSQKRGTTQHKHPNDERCRSDWENCRTLFLNIILKLSCGCRVWLSPLLH